MVDREKKRREHQTRMEEILIGAKFIFISKGFNDATMKDIAIVSHLSRRTLYLYFHNKEEILLTMAVTTLQSLLSDIKSNTDSFDTGLNKLLKIAKGYSNLFLTDQASFKFVPNFTNCVATLSTDNPVVKKCSDTVHEIMNLVCMYLKEGINDGSIRPIDNIDKTATFIISIIHSCIQSIDTDNVMMREALMVEPADFLDEARKVIMNYLTKGLQPATVTHALTQPHTFQRIL